MNGSVIYLTQFGGQTLHNGTTLYASSTVTAAHKASYRPIKLPNGRLFDPYQTYDAPVEPAPFSSKLLIKMDKDAAVTEFEALAALIGTRETLTGKRDTTVGMTVTCTARLTAVTNVNRNSVDSSGGIRVELTFVPVDLWS